MFIYIRTCFTYIVFIFIYSFIHHLNIFYRDTLNMDVYEVTLINLDVLSKVQAYERVNTTLPLFKIHITNSYIPSWFVRWWSSQSRNCDISRIQHLYQTAIYLMELEDERKETIQKYVSSSIKGLKQIKMTYENDSTIIAQIDMILHQIHTYID